MSKRELTKKEKIAIINYVTSDHLADNMLEDLEDVYDLYEETDREASEIIWNFQVKIKQKIIKMINSNEI